MPQQHSSRASRCMRSKPISRTRCSLPSHPPHIRAPLVPFRLRTGPPFPLCSCKTAHQTTQDLGVPSPCRPRGRVLAHEDPERLRKPIPRHAREVLRRLLLEGTRLPARVRHPSRPEVPPPARASGRVRGGRRGLARAVAGGAPPVRGAGPRDERIQRVPLGLAPGKAACGGGSSAGGGRPTRRAAREDTGPTGDARLPGSRPVRDTSSTLGAHAPRRPPRSSRSSGPRTRGPPRPCS